MYQRTDSLSRVALLSFAWFVFDVSQVQYLCFSFCGKKYIRWVRRVIFTPPPQWKFFSSVFKWEGFEVLRKFREDQLEYTGRGREVHLQNTGLKCLPRILAVVSEALFTVLYLILHPKVDLEANQLCPSFSSRRAIQTLLLSSKLLSPKVIFFFFSLSFSSKVPAQAA